MRINFIFDKKNSFSNYENIIITEGDVSLDTVCEDAECSEILATDIIGYFRAEQVGPLIEQWIRKLRLAGKIIIGGIDVGEVARQMVNKNLTLTDANTLLYGEQSEPWQFRQSGLTLEEVVKALKVCGLRILKKRLNGYTYLVEAERTV